MPPPFPPVGRKVLLTFALVGDGTPITCEARVQWHNTASIFKGCGALKTGLPPGCGLAFLAVDSADAERIATHISAYREHRARFEGIPGALNAEAERPEAV